MKFKYVPLVCLLPLIANAAIPYQTEQVKTTITAEEQYYGLNDSEALARNRRFYVGGMYNFSFWQGGADDHLSVDGKNTSSFEAMVGVRVFDTFRIEGNYVRTNAKWDAFSMTGNTAFINAIFDGRIDSHYRLFQEQLLVPYVGVGAGLSWNSADGAEIDKKMTPAVAAMVGMGVEFNDRFTLDLGYRYICIFSPDFNVISDLPAVSHQLRAGVRINF